MFLVMIHFRKQLRWLLCFLVLSAAVGSGIVWRERQQRKQKDHVTVWREQGLAAVREQVEGFVVFERLGKEHRGIWVQTLGEKEVKCLTSDGRFPRISHDGQTVYFLRGDNVICRVPAQGGKVRVLVEWDRRIPAISVHPDKPELYFVCSSEIWKLNTTNLQVSRMEPTPKPVAAVDVDRAGDLVFSTYEGKRYEIWKQRMDQLTRTEWDAVDIGCSAAISPDGHYFTDNNNRHEFIDVRSFQTNEVLYSIYTSPEAYLVDNEAWTNLDDWLVFISQNRRRRFVWLYRMGMQAPLRVTFTWDADRPDAFITRVKQPPTTTTHRIAGSFPEEKSLP